MLFKAIGLNEVSQEEKAVSKRGLLLRISWNTLNLLRLTGGGGGGGGGWENTVLKEGAWEFESDSALWKYSSFLVQINILSNI